MNIKSNKAIRHILALQLLKWKRAHIQLLTRRKASRVPLRSCFNWAKNKKMESTQSSGNSTTVDNAMSSNNNSHNCLIPSVYFEIGTSTIPYTVNTVLNALLCIVATLAGTFSNSEGALSSPAIKTSTRQSCFHGSRSEFSCPAAICCVPCCQGKGLFCYAMFLFVY